MKIAIELDGGQHNQSKIKKYDAIRSQYLNAQGIEVIRFWDHEVLLDMKSVINELESKVTPPHLPLI